MSNRIAVFDDGVIQQLAPPDQLYEKPENAFVARFIGENNTLHGKVAQVNGNRCTVEVPGGGMVEALPVNIAGVGQPTTLSLRPERVVINPNGNVGSNTFDAEVQELIYLGDHIRTRVTVAGNRDFIIKVPNSHGHAVLTQGAMIKVGWSAEDCRALDA